MLADSAYLFAALLNSEVLMSNANFRVRSLDPIPSPESRCIYLGWRTTSPAELFPGNDFQSARGFLARFGERLLEEYESKHTRKRGLLHAREKLAVEFLGRGDTVMTPPEDRTHSVYVVQLDSAAREKLKVLKENPNGHADMPCVYVGSTGKSPYERFLTHMRGGQSSVGLVHEHGTRLLPALYSHLNPMTELEALLREDSLAKFLRRQGYWVMGGH